LKSKILPDYSPRIKELRKRFSLTQMRLAELMGVSFATINRWENGQTKPSSLAWQQIILSIAAPCVPVIAALMCTTKRSVEGVRILDLLGHQKLKYSRQNPFCGRVGGSDRRWSWMGGDAVVVVVVGKWAVLFCPLFHNQLGIFW
jgi:DNA-binding XRE family transcriptional regulator